MDKILYELNRIISIHASREEGDRKYGNNYLFQIISIHASREEGDGTLQS